MGSWTQIHKLPQHLWLDWGHVLFVFLKTKIIELPPGLLLFTISTPPRYPADAGSLSTVGLTLPGTPPPGQ